MKSYILISICKLTYDWQLYDLVIYYTSHSKWLFENAASILILAYT